ncbi:MAG: catalase family peroxidase [Acidocella sp.]|nr:catalase family peroxidase [Acidocella sp.]
MMELIRKRLAEPGGWLRLAVVATVPAALGAAFVFAAGWLSPGRLTPATFMHTFLVTSGAQPGFRRNHAKGVCVTGWFDGNVETASFSRAALFTSMRSPVVGRFALAGGMPYQDDTPGTVRSLALRIMPAHGGEWRMGINDIPVFPAPDAATFNALLLASWPDSRTGKPDPTRMAAFLVQHPETKRALALISSRRLTSGFADDTYNSLDSFTFVNAQGIATPVRWAMVPEQKDHPPAPQEKGPDYLFNDLITAIGQGALHWHLIVTLGNPGDPTADPALPWSGPHRQLDAGTLTLTAAQSEDGGPCTGITYDPLVLPDGIAPSDDPIPAARSAVYSRSFTLRSGEIKPASAITPADVNPGAQ